MHNATVTLPNGHVIPAEYVGVIRLNSKLLLRRVLYVPQFKFNLLSVSSLTTDSELIVHFHHDLFFIQEISTKQMIGKGERLGDLYILDLTRYAPAHNSLAKHVSVQLWHQRFWTSFFQGP